MAWETAGSSRMEGKKQRRQSLNTPSMSPTPRSEHYGLVPCVAQWGVRCGERGAEMNSDTRW
jgi:hypothetical protein